jgi:hypothetical protein
LKPYESAEESFETIRAAFLAPTAFAVCLNENNEALGETRVGHAGVYDEGNLV